MSDTSSRFLEHPLTNRLYFADESPFIPQRIAFTWRRKRLSFFNGTLMTQMRLMSAELFFDRRTEGHVFLLILMFLCLI
jgi:hypothetical protein